jgi:aspartate dehydrogenase
MSTASRIGLLGFGRIGRYVAARIGEESTMELAFVCDRSVPAVEEADAAMFESPAEAVDREVDLIVEAAHAGVVVDHGAALLGASDLLTLSTTALADETVERELREACVEGGTRLHVPHGAVLGTDGLQDGRPSLETVSITTHKNPANIDFAESEVDPATIDAETTLYDGPTRGICAEFPRNVNSHATVAVAGLGFDATTSTLIADPEVTDATHQIVAEGDGTRLEIGRTSAIEGVTGSYTLDSIWGTIGRIVDDAPGLVVV